LDKVKWRAVSNVSKLEPYKIVVIFGTWSYLYILSTWICSKCFQNCMQNMSAPKVLASKCKNVNGIKYFPKQDNFNIYHYI